MLIANCRISGEDWTKISLKVAKLNRGFSKKSKLPMNPFEVNYEVDDN